MSLVRGLTKVGAKAVKKTAPFYSAVDEALANLKRPKGTGAEFLTEVLKQPGVKKAEIADRKLEQAFKAKGKMTKEEAQQVLKENPPPKLQERELTEITDDMREAELRDKIETSGYDKWSEVPQRVLQMWNEEIDHNMEKFGDYRLPGGKNYREILLKLPKLDTKDGDKNYWSTHYLQDPNVLAHMRVQDRLGPNGEKILHVEEIQSDWHQTGRKKGYKPEDYIEQSNALDKEFNDLAKKRADLFQEAERIGYRGEGFHNLIEQGNSITPQLMRLQEQRDNLKNVINYGVPDAPFKKNWHELAMKRLLNYAADNGYDSIAITPGAEQANRYPRRNEAEKIAQEQGMSGFYDKMLPDYLNSFGKPYGAKVEQLPIDKGGYKVNRDSNELPYRLETETSPDIISRFATAEEAWKEAERLGTLPLHSFKITPEMRESIKQKGLPLYQQIGIPTAGAGAASQMPEDPEYSGGGSVAKMAALAKLKQLRQEMAPRAEAVKNLIAKDANAYLRDVVPNSLTNPEIEAEIARMAARAKAAGQQEGVLPTAQRDANLAKFLEESKIKNRVYHGTGADVQEFKPSVIGAMGPGTYVTTNPDVASGYSKVISHRRPENNPNVLPLHVQVKNPFPISSVNRSGSEFFLKFDPTGKLSDAEVIELAKKAGYDAVHALEEGELNIFDPSRIKSSIGNRGTYDVNELDIKKADGGAINYNTAPDMSDGGRIIESAPFKHGGKVNMTANCDAMFMELSNKKLKRK